MEDINEFSKREGHMADTPANRQALEDLVRDPKNFVGKSFRKTDWYTKTLPSGYQVWAQVRGGTISNGGINRIPRPFKPEAGIDDQKNQEPTIFADLTPLRAFNATAKFLDAYYEKNPSEDLAVYLEDMEFLRDNKTTDPSVLNYWMWLINMNIAKDHPTARESFDLMVVRIDAYQSYMVSKDIAALLKSMELPENNIEDSIVWKHWMKCINEALSEPEGSRSYLRSRK